MTHPTKAAMTAAYEAARDEARKNPSPETREAAKQASLALSAWIVQNDPPKRRGWSSRAGKRQFAEHCARHNVRRPNAKSDRAAETAELMEDFNYVGSRHHY